MLPPELVRTRVKAGKLELVQLSKKARERALELGAQYIAIAESQVGNRRAELEGEFSLVERGVRERKLADGLCKLVRDACEFSSFDGEKAHALRRTLFERAATARADLREGEVFDPEAVTAAVAAELAISKSEIAERLFADLKENERLKSLAPLDAETLLERYLQGQVQGVLLRAVSVRATVSCSSPEGYRALFQRLKFRGLLFRIEREPEGYAVEIDGPLSLFESSTKYGLNLALAYNALAECERLELRAQVKWARQTGLVEFSTSQSRQSPTVLPAVLRPEVERLVEGLRGRHLKYELSTSPEVLHLPGVGLCVPDIALRDASGRRVFVEVMGFWSREAVWRRVELVEKGLTEQILFAVSTRLRVSEAVLGERESSALYVYKGVMSPSQVARRVQALFDKTPRQ